MSLYDGAKFSNLKDIKALINKYLLYNYIPSKAIYEQCFNLNLSFVASALKHATMVLYDNRVIHLMGF